MSHFHFACVVHVHRPRTADFLKQWGHQLRQVSGEANSFAYLTQRLSVAVQRGDAASVLGTMQVDSEDEEFFLHKYCFMSYVLCL